MDLITLAKLIPGIFAARQFFEEPLTHRVLTELADADGRAAGRALSDAMSCSDRHIQMVAAVTLLYSAYEKHRSRAENRTSGLRNRIQAYIRFDKTEQAAFRSAMTALFIARINKEMGEDLLAVKWRERGRADFDNWQDLAWRIVHMDELAYFGAHRFTIYPPQCDRWLHKHADAFEEAYAAVASDGLPV